MAKGGVSGKNNRDSNSKRLGIKCYAGEAVEPGNIILRQRGSRFKAGTGTAFGTDFTIYAKTAGKVHFGNNRVVSIVSK